MHWQRAEAARAHDRSHLNVTMADIGRHFGSPSSENERKATVQLMLASLCHVFVINSFEHTPNNQ
jgi:hypothetical protein